MTKAHFINATHTTVKTVHDAVWSETAEIVRYFAEKLEQVELVVHHGVHFMHHAIHVIKLIH